MSSNNFRSGFVAVVGRPNTGKSTLVNALVSEKISIVTAKAQTTRHRILGILTDSDRQIIFVDTPGLHEAGGKLINQAMNRTASAAMIEADVILLVIEATGWRRGDERVLEQIRATGLPAMLIVNKVDLVKDKTALLPLLQELSTRFEFAEVFPVSALRDASCDRILNALTAYLPEGPELFPADMRTDKSIEFRFAEMLREKLLESLHQEVPYGLAVEISAFERRGDLYLAEATIWTDKESHKGIVIGRDGERLKFVGRAARIELEKIFGQRVHLETRVKLKQNWSDSERALRQFGYEAS